MIHVQNYMYILLYMRKKLRYMYSAGRSKNNIPMVKELTDAH